MKGLWKDKQTGTVAEVISSTDEAVWYLIPEWRGPQNCSREVFEAVMEPVTAANFSPSNASAMAAADKKTPTKESTP